jgi:hypothetical protein
MNNNEKIKPKNEEEQKKIEVNENKVFIFRISGNKLNINDNNEEIIGSKKKKNKI